MTKFLLFTFAAFTINAGAETVSISCKQASDTIGRPEGVQAMVYNVDVGRATAHLSCGTKITSKVFCKGIRMDLSGLQSASRLETCREARNGSARTVYLFNLAQEDEFDNLVVLTVSKDCASGKIIDEQISAVITQENDEEVPEASVVVKCSVKK